MSNTTYSKEKPVDPEVRYRDLLESITDGLISIGSDWRIRYLNEKATQGGLYPPDQLIGKVLWEAFPDILGTPLERVYRQVMDRSEASSLETKGLIHDRWYRINVYPSREGITVYWLDITGQKDAEGKLLQLNRTLAALSDSRQAQLHPKTETEYLCEVCRIINEDCGHALVWIGYAEEDQAKTVLPVAFSGFEKGYLDTLKISWADDRHGRGPTGTAIRTGRVSLCRNMLTDPAYRPWRKEAIRYGYASSIALPLITDDKPFGALTIYSQQPDAFSENEVELLTELANDLAYGITAIHLRQARAEALAALRESEARYRSLFEGMTEGFALHEIICDEHGKPTDYRFLDMNPAFEQLTGLTRKVVMGKTVREALPEIEEFWIETYGRVALTGEPAHFENYAEPLGKYYDVIAYSPATGKFATIFVDITQRKQAEAEAQRLAASLEIQKRLIEQRELERLQIARDLHDGPVQELTAASLALQGMLLDSTDPKMTAEIETVRNTLLTQVHELRAYAVDLRPPALSKFGLEKALLSLTESFREKYPEIQISLVAHQEGGLLPEQFRLALYRIAQEALNNVVKHSRANEVEVRFLKENQLATLEIQDNGVGFDLPDDWLVLARQGHLGLVGMRERAEAINGRFQVASTPGAGTTIRVDLSLGPS